MVKKIPKITTLPDHINLDQLIQKWININLCTDPVDRKAGEKAVDLAYERAGLKPPKTKIWCDSPMLGALAANEAMEEKKNSIKNVETPIEGLVAVTILRTPSTVKRNISQQLEDQIHDQVSNHPYQKIGLKPSFAIKKYIPQQDWYNLDGSISSHWLVYREIYALIYPEDNSDDGLLAVAQNCGWWWPFDDVAILTDRPKTFKLDENGEFHCPNGPALEYRDGFSQAFWHGLAVPTHFVTNNVTPIKIKQEPNTEKRRVLMEIYLEKTGIGSILQALDAEILDSDKPLGLERKLVQICGDHYLYCTNGTLEQGKHRQFLLGVPSGKYHDWRNGHKLVSVQTAHQASAWTYGIDPDKYQEQVRT